LVLITGANGNLGRRLLEVLSRTGTPVRAVVRSDRAAAQIRNLALARPPEVVQVDYLDPDAMRAALAGCTAVVHLVGIIKESARSRYQDAHEGATRVLAAAAARAGVGRIVCLSILGASPAARNACLRSKGLGEQILLKGVVPALVLRVPMVLGEGDYASAALAGRARKRINVLLRSGSREQPIYAGDVIAAIMVATSRGEPYTGAMDLAGPRSLSRAQLTQRAAATLGRHARIVSLPLALGMVLAGALETLLPNPPITRAMLGVLDHDDDIDPSPAVRALGLELTPLEEMLRRCVGGSVEAP